MGRNAEPSTRSGSLLLSRRAAATEGRGTAVSDAPLPLSEAALPDPTLGNPPTLPESEVRLPDEELEAAHPSPEVGPPSPNGAATDDGATGAADDVGADGAADDVGAGEGTEAADCCASTLAERVFAAEPRAAAAWVRERLGGILPTTEGPGATGSAPAAGATLAAVGADPAEPTAWAVPVGTGGNRLGRRVRADGEEEPALDGGDEPVLTAAVDGGDELGLAAAADGGDEPALTAVAVEDAADAAETVPAPTAAPVLPSDPVDGKAPARLLAELGGTP